MVSLVLIMFFFCLVYVVYHLFIHFVCCQQWQAIHWALSRMQAENELLWYAWWGALCTISGLRGHPTPSAEVHCSINAKMYRGTIRMHITQNTKLYCSLHKFLNVHKEIDAHYTILNFNYLLCPA